MRFLIPIVMLLATSVFMSREPQEPPVVRETAQQVYTSEAVEVETAAEATDADAEYDEIIEASGMLNRLELLDF